MNFHYDKTTDSLYIKLLPQGTTESEEVAPDVIADYDAMGNIVGLDIQHASKNFDFERVSFTGFTPKVEVQPNL